MPAGAGRLWCLQLAIARTAGHCYWALR